MEEWISFFSFLSLPLGPVQWSYTRDELYPKQVFFTVYFVLIKMHKQLVNQITSEVTS